MLSASDFPVQSPLRERILDRMIRKHFKVPSEVPEVIYVAGQPASGKSHLVHTLTTDHQVLDSDILRKNHPDLNRIMTLDPIRMDVLTNEPINYWMSGLIDHARLHRHSVIIENTLSNPSFIATEIEKFRAKGFRVSLAAMAVSQEVSRLGVIQRYLEAARFDPYPRWTSELSHSNGYKALVPGLKVLAPLADEVTIFTRDMRRIDMDEIEHERATWFDNPNHRETFLTRFEELELTEHLKEQSLTQNLLADVEKIRSWK